MIGSAELDMIDARDASAYDGADAVRQIHELTAEIRRLSDINRNMVRSHNAINLDGAMRESVDAVFAMLEQHKGETMVPAEEVLAAIQRRPARFV